MLLGIKTLFSSFCIPKQEMTEVTSFCASVKPAAPSLQVPGLWTRLSHCWSLQHPHLCIPPSPKHPGHPSGAARTSLEGPNPTRTVLAMRGAGLVHGWVVGFVPAVLWHTYGKGARPGRCDTAGFWCSKTRADNADTGLEPREAAQLNETGST